MTIALFQQNGLVVLPPIVLEAPTFLTLAPVEAGLQLAIAEAGLQLADDDRQLAIADDQRGLTVG